MDQFIVRILFGVVLFVPAGALVGLFACRLIARFRPSYVAALKSTFVAYLVAYAVTSILQTNEAVDSRTRLIMLHVVTSWCVLSGAHMYFLRSSENETIEPWKAFAVGLVQTLIVLAFVYLLITVVQRTLAVSYSEKTA